jgi:hypothetical protein
MRHSRGVADTLTAVTAQWPSPQARDFRSGDSPDSPRQARKAEQGWSNNLNDVVEGRGLWMTPDVPNGGRALPKGTSQTGKRPDGSKAQVGLNNQVSMWTTPQAHDVTQRGSGQQPTAKAGNACLARDATTWPTPSAMQDTKGDADLGAISRRESLGKQIGLAHRSRQFSRPDQPTAPHGLMLSQLRPIWRPLRASVIASHGRGTWRRLWKGRNKRRLNPLFVEWLMGWPSGHALCASSVTEWCSWQRLMRGALSQLPTAYGRWIWKPPAEQPRPVQFNLFGGE